MVTMTAGYCPLPAGTATFCRGDSASRYGKSVALVGSPYSVTHAWPAQTRSALSL